MSDWKNVQYKDGKMRTSEGGGGGGSSTFAGLNDVNFSNLQNGQVPKYNSSTQKWENANESGGGGTVTDVQVDGVSVVNQQGVAEIETPNADGIEYDNQQSGLQATDVQSAIDELAQGSGGVEDVEVNGASVVNAQKVAEIKSYKEITQAEYQALPSSKLSDDILYCIKDSAGADGFPPLIYSDEEREVGVWRDGKPLYQRTFTVTLNANELRNLDTNIEFCFLVGNSYITSNQVLSEQYIDSATRIYCYVDTYLENGIWTMRIQNMFGSQLTYCVTVRYTKTTDTAGSGTWTTQGGYAHHYSTTEHVIGTWIDGKPLYQKSISLAGISIATGQYAIVYTQANIELKYANGYFIEGNYVYTVPEPFLRIRQDGNNIVFRAMEPSAWNISGGFLTIRYTKTTD